MNDNVQISFIPKRPLARGELLRTRRPVFGMTFVVSLALIIMTIGAAVGEMLYIQYLTNGLEKRAVNLRDIRENIEASDTMSNLDDVRAVQKKISIVRDVLDSHVAPSMILAFLSKTTLPEVTYTKYSYAKTDRSVELSLAGEAVSYEALAYQSQVYRESEDYLISYSVSDFSLTENGTISFAFSGELRPDVIEFKKIFVEDSFARVPLISGTQFEQGDDIVESVFVATSSPGDSKSVTSGSLHMTDDTSQSNELDS